MDYYFTIEKSSVAEFKDRGSKFLGYIFPIETVEDFKKWCDEYFYLKHREEPRGIGGIFFDDFNELGFEQSFAMTRAVGDAFINAYLPIVERRHQESFTPEEKA